MRLILVCFLLVVRGCLCYALETKECPGPKIRRGNVKGRGRSLEFANPVTNGRRVSRCRGSGTPTCSPEESQNVADVYCQGVGFEFAFSWQAATVNDTLCFPEVVGLDGEVCDNAEGACQSFEKIVCAGPKVVRGFIEAGSGFGIVEFKQDGKAAAVQVVFRVDGLPKGDLEFAIHNGSVSDDCTGIGKEITCDGKKGCGHISGRMGKLRGPKVSKVVVDKKGGLTLFGAHSIEGDAMVFRDKKGQWISCGSLRQRSDVVLPEALVPMVESGEDALDGLDEGIHQAKIFGGAQHAQPAGVTGSAGEMHPSFQTRFHSASSAPGSLALATLFQPSIRTFTPHTLSRCPIGKVCPTRKCRANCDNLQTCCRCIRWLTKDGSCAPDGWIKVQGRGHCKFSTDCPPGVVCLTVKRLRTLTRSGVTETCCECLAHNPDGSCKPEGFKLVRGTGECSFGADPLTSRSLPSNVGALPQGD